MSDAVTLIRSAFEAYRRDDLGEAERLCHVILAETERHPDARLVFDAHHLLAVVNTRRNRPEEALASYAKALSVQPDHVGALSNRGVMLDHMRRHQEALDSLDRALAIRPDYAPALSNRGNALGALGQFDAALASYDAALAIRPDFADCRLNRALLLLLRGRFAEGWREYEWRRRLKTWIPRGFDVPEWRGEDLRGKRLFLYAEQGLGDTIQFGRFVPLLAGRGAEIILEVQPPLAGLMRSLPGASRILRQGEPVSGFAFRVPLMSVPVVLGLDEAGIPAAVPYLRADPERAEAWKKRLPQAGFRVGVCWQGNPLRKIDRGRSIPLATLAPLGRIPGVRLVSLQKHAGVEQLAELPAGMQVVDLGPEFDAGPDGFLDAAAVMASLDLIVTSDNTIAHLAGALGRPVWILLKEVPDWRWMLDRADSPWYPTARLFRQTRRDDWDEVVGRVAAALGAEVVARAAPPPSPPGAVVGRPAVGAPRPGAGSPRPRRPDRRERFLRWNAGKGIELRLAEAVDGRGLRRSELVGGNLIEAESLGFSSGALGNALSHRSLWQTCIRLGQPIIVFEDDAFIPAGAEYWLARIREEVQESCDILYLGYNWDAILSVGFGGQWCNVEFERPAAGFEAFAARHDRWSGTASQAIVDVRLAWGILAYAIAPRGAQLLLDTCFPISTRGTVRMYGSGRVFVPDALDGIINVAIQRGLIRARAFFPPLAIGPNDRTDSDVAGSMAGG